LRSICSSLALTPRSVPFFAIALPFLQKQQTSSNSPHYSSFFFFPITDDPVKPPHLPIFYQSLPLPPLWWDFQFMALLAFPFVPPITFPFPLGLCFFPANFLIPDTRIFWSFPKFLPCFRPASRALIPDNPLGTFFPPVLGAPPFYPPGGRLGSYFLNRVTPSQVKPLFIVCFAGFLHWEGFTPWLSRSFSPYYVFQPPLTPWRLPSPPLIFLPPFLYLLPSFPHFGRLGLGPFSKVFVLPKHDGTCFSGPSFFGVLSLFPHPWPSVRFY